MEGTEYSIILNVDASIANAIRRTIISKIPTMVIETVCIRENDSNLCDEMIAHRLGLIPLRIKGQYSDELIISLDEIGPKRVYSRDIKFPDGIEAVSNDIIILDLELGQTLKLTGNIEEGTVSDQGHNKYSVSCGTSYQKLDENLFKICVETTGSINAKDALLKSIEILKDELSYYKKIV